MNLNPLNLLLQFGHALQRHLFPRLEASVGPLNPNLQLLASVMAMVPLERLLSARRARTGRPAKDRAALVTAFVAKAILNLPTTRDLIERLRVDDALRELCGFGAAGTLPHESKFSRAFAAFAASELPQQLHEAVIEITQKGRLIGHIARDSTAIPARESSTQQKEKRATGKQKPKRKQRRAASRAASKRGGRVRARRAEAKAKPGARIMRQRTQKLKKMLAELPRSCDVGAKTNSQGHNQYWHGYKLHLDVADGQIPISAVLSSASVHDSQVAVPLMTLTSARVTYCYELMDSAYDADAIHEQIREMGHVPIIAPHPRRGTKKPSQLPKIYPPQPAPEMDPAAKARFRERTMVERVYSRLKDEFGASRVRVRGAAKVMAHLMFGVLALTVDQWLRMRPSVE